MNRPQRLARRAVTTCLCLAFAGCTVQGPQAPSGSSSGQGNAGEYYLLGIFRPAGGTIVSSDGRINCGVAEGATKCGDASGQFRFAWSETTTLTAIPAPGYKFEGWAGDCSGKTCFVSTDVKRADWYVVANFVPDAVYRGVYFVVSVDKPVNGTIRSSNGSIECGTAGDRCGPTLVPWTGAATLTANADAGFVLSSWTGDCAGAAATGTTCLLDTKSFATDKQIGATFGTSTGPQPLVWDSGNWDEVVWQ